MCARSGALAAAGVACSVSVRSAPHTAPVERLCGGRDGAAANTLAMGA